MKKIFFILLPFFGLLSNSAFSQETAALEWAKRMGSTGSDGGQDIVLDGAGNIYTTGSFSATVDFDPGAGTFNLTSAGSNDIFISKLDANGDFVWARSMGGVGSEGGAGIAVDLSGNVYITGGFQGTADFDPGPGTFTMTAATTGQTDIYIVKLDANGNFVWAKGIIGGTWWDNGLKIVLDGAANVHVVGRFYYQGGARDFDPGPGTFFLTAGQEDAFILKLDTNGNFIWARNFGGGFFENRGYSIVLDAVGNIYTTGYFEGTIDFDPGAGTFNLTASGDWDVYYSKLDANGNFVWARAMVNSNPNYYTDGTYGRKISLDGAGNLYATSRFNGTVDFDPGVGIFNLTSLGGFDIFITKLTTDGDFVWAKSMGGSGYDEGMTIANDAAGNVYITGYFAQSVDFDPGAGVSNRTSAGSNDIFVCKFDSNGNFKWAGSMGGINDDRGIGLNLDTTGNIYMVGGFQSTSDFDPRPCIYNLTSAGSSDIFILKLSQTTLTPLSISSITPDNGPEGSSVTIAGTGFSTTPANNTVTFFSNKSGTVTASTATSITTTVPTGATTGTIAVTVDCINVNSASNFIVTAPLLPTITSFTPASGTIGTTVTITGTNFSTTPANNIAYFGATRAIVSLATPTKLTVTVPLGATYQPITVLVNGLTAYSSKPFVVTFADGGVIDACSFATKVDFATGSSPELVSIGDLDGDGKDDLVVANRFSNTVSVYRNTSSGSGNISYAATVDFTTGTQPFSVAIGDLDGDGKADMAVGNIVGSVSVFRNTSSGTGNISYAAKVDFATVNGFPQVSIGDLDGDGKTDLAVAITSANAVSVFRNTSSGAGNISYAAKIDFTTGSNPESISIGDLDGDGKADMAVANFLGNTVSVFRNTSSGAGNISYAAKVDFTTGVGPFSVSIGDLDGDGKDDLAVANASSATVSVLSNTSSGAGNISYAAKVDFTTGSQPWSVSIGDLDGDGKADLAVANASSATVSVLRNTSSGAGNISYAFKVDFTTGINPLSVSIADLDGDGKPDLAVANRNSNTVSVLRNTVSSLPPFTGSSIDPMSGPVGTVVTFTGTNYSTTPLNNTIKFNGVTALVTASSSTSITAIVPVGATTGTISIQIGCVKAISVSPFTVTAALAPTITSFNPTSGPIGTMVTITGTNFSATPTNNAVQFNGTTATVISSTATSITTTVPSGATTGKITVTVSGNTATSASDFTVTTSTNNQPPVIASSTSAAPINGIITIDLLPLISDPDDNVDLSTLSLSSNTSEQGAVAIITASFELVLDYGGVSFAGIDHVLLSVCDLLGACDDQELSIEVRSDVIVYNAVSPNNDGLNDIFYIQYINLLPETQNNKVTIYNRWGAKVYEVSDYNNDTNVFKGLNQNGGELPSGTYYYKIEFTNGQSAKTGYLALKR